MGQVCCSREEVIMNEGENFIEELIYGLNIRTLNFDQIKIFFGDCLEKEIIKDGNILKETIFIAEKSYLNFLDYYFYLSDPSDNAYFLFHKMLAPSYDDIIAIDKFEYTFHQHVLSFYQSHDKTEIVFKIFNLKFFICFWSTFNLIISLIMS